ncbi:hypothetical protein ACQKMD_19260 [Viridibacillus sp. NPDC096237]|uniref:hypothetical protein n=1 Tax=Viridibacillus sp. NPDC096237 TaxID=3390721 RepID=UPI003D00F96A
MLDKQLARQMRFILMNELSGIFHLGAVNMIKECAFFEELAIKLTSRKVNIQDTPYQDKVQFLLFRSRVKS